MNKSIIEKFKHVTHVLSVLLYLAIPLTALATGKTIRDTNLCSRDCICLQSSSVLLWDKECKCSEEVANAPRPGFPFRCKTLRKSDGFSVEYYDWFLGVFKPLKQLSVSELGTQRQVKSFKIFSYDVEKKTKKTYSVISVYLFKNSSVINWGNNDDSKYRFGRIILKDNEGRLLDFRTQIAKSKLIKSTSQRTEIEQYSLDSPAGIVSFNDNKALVDYDHEFYSGMLFGEEAAEAALYRRD